MEMAIMGDVVIMPLLMEIILVFKGWMTRLRTVSSGRRGVE
jgi:hypothetical protein